MDEQTLASRLSDLASEAEYLANTIYLDEEVPAERTRRHTHRLRETLATALVLSERLAREAGMETWLSSDSAPTVLERRHSP